MHRRSFLHHAGMCVGGVATFGFPTVRFASVPQRGRLVFVLLRGGFDGLAALVPAGDGAYRNLRGAMAFDEADLVGLSDGFGLAPGLAGLESFWDRDELVALHAMAIPYRTRSHFDGQAVLETGLARPEGASAGWLNRLLQVLEGERSGIAIAAGMPRSMIGDHPVSTWSPTELGAVDDAYLDRLHLLYRSDRRLLNRFEAAIQQRETVAGVEMGGTGARGRGAVDVEALFRSAARLLRPATGPNVAAMELSGWDTHANQGLAGGPLDRLLARLSDGLVAFRDDMEDAWADTTVVVMTEFGRTARLNGTRGTDHGTAGAGFVLGPRVARSMVHCDWPGLSDSDLYEGRDLRPTLDTRAVLKGVVMGAFDLTANQANRVFPDSDGVRAVDDVMR